MFFKRFLAGLVPRVKAEEEEEAEMVDPQQQLRDKCRENDEHCKHLVGKYQECNDRVLSKSQTAETCVEELIDLLHAVDHCVAKDLFKRLK